MRITKVVTRTGDRGETSLVGGTRVPKDATRVAAFGDVDELNSWIGLARAHLSDERLDAICATLQHQLFVLGADLSTPMEREGTRVEASHVAQVEAFVEELMAELTPLKEFVLPGGGPAGATLHLARATCRRAERTVVTLRAREPVNEPALVYLNRLSDLLFVLARVANRRAGVAENLADFTRHPPRRPRST